MATTLHCTIGGTEYGTYLRGLELEASGPRTVGNFTLHISKQAGGLTIGNMAEVKVWEESSPGVVSYRFCGGFAVDRGTGNFGTEKTWVIQCVDYNYLLDTFVADANFFSRVWDHGTVLFEDQIDYILRVLNYADTTFGTTFFFNTAITGTMGGVPPTIAFTGGGGSGAAATVLVGGGAVSSVSLTSGGTGYTSAPTATISGGTGTGATATAVLGVGTNAGKVASVTVTAGGSGYRDARFSNQGGTLREILTERCQAYNSIYPMVRPAFAILMAGTGFVAPSLEIWDAALTPTPQYHFTNESSGGNKRPYFDTYSRQLDGKRTATQVQAQGLVNGILVTATGRSAQALRDAEPNPYDARPVAGGGGTLVKAWQDPLIKVQGASSSAQIQAVADRYIASRENARESIPLHVAVRVLPGSVQTHTNSLEGISGVNYRVAGARFDFAEYPVEDIVSVILGALPLELGEGNDDDVLSAPIEADRVPPEPPTGLAVVSNLYNYLDGNAHVVFSFSPSPSLDVAYYWAYATQNGRALPRLRVDATDRRGWFNFWPDSQFSIYMVAEDTSQNVGAPSSILTGIADIQGIQLGGYNFGFEAVSDDDPTQPDGWTAVLGAGASAVLDTTNVSSGTRSYKLVSGTASGGTGAIYGTSLYGTGTYGTGGGTGGSATVTSSAFPLTTFDGFLLSMDVQGLAATTLAINVRMLDKTGTYIGERNGTVSVSTGMSRQVAVWDNSVFVGAYTQAQIQIVLASPPATTVWIDNLSVGNTYAGLNRSGASFVTQVAALPTSATTGFLYIPTTGGPPTGIPKGETGTVAQVFDISNSDLYIYNSGWKKIHLS